ncbi:hypothetical protein ACTEYT_09955 (plasmid) [Limosilactobacillus reuteri]|uniref:Uncharacterized protein n=2 Tax=Limosilactobacillus reuteri TaxID=1598 RepID=A0A1V4FIP1_LIMRT|nr:MULTISPECIES: hypothetical protein [Limosilactobacillus]CCC04511.1 hypothetical protein LRATCC53608_1758 [Limosilactobacillus reuteri subsp. suis]MDM8265443.1 hypothetical protein [Limosilactobacillus vaginalis]MQB84396.1 hypothetical protein [Limosilactobacillus reuteri]OPG87238.1 hypothetical protein B5D07_10605 [Limosilactobacillus reuteri]CUU13563.1 hypothetical protein LRATCC53608_pI151 [Limosilactobacillus reuteri subsp. suis]
MELKEFVQKGYTINAQVPVVETHEVNLDNLEEDMGDNLGEVIDTWIDDSKPVSYDILDPDGELISGYKPTLFDDEDVRAFIANL